jgi:replicative DNA helicase
VIPFLKSEYFSERPERVLFEHIFEFFQKYNSQATIETLYIDVNKDEQLNGSDVDSIIEILNSPETEVNSKWLKDETEKFCQERSVYNAVLESIQILDDKSKDKEKGAIPKLLSDALAVSFDSHVGHDYLEDSESRFEFYHKKDSHFRFDLDFFNKITDGGLMNKTLNVFMGGPGTGKTLVMCHLASWYLTQGKNVLYITLEMAEERISERIDANLLNTPLKDLTELPKSIYDKKVERIRKNTTGKLIIKEYPTAQAGVGHFRHHINELTMKKSFSADIIIVDYINICTSSRMKPGGSINSYTYIKSIAEELRGFAVEQAVPLITATQVNREGFGSSDIGMENTAESFGLPATADLFLALITSEELDSLNQIMVKQLKNRYNDPTVHRRFVVGVDRTKMRLYDVDQSAQENINDVPMMDQSSVGQRISKERRDFSEVIV